MKSLTDEIDHLIQTQADLWNCHDTKGYAHLWTEDCTFVNVVGMHRGNRAELLAELDYLHRGRFKNTQVTMERLTLRFLSPELAVATVRWDMTGDPGIPGFPTQNGERRGIFTHLVLRTAEGWRFAASQNTDTLPIPDPLHTAQPALAAV